eukprot:764850-Hanusia_phi.AAC.10
MPHTPYVLCSPQPLHHRSRGLFLLPHTEREGPQAPERLVRLLGGRDEAEPLAGAHDPRPQLPRA